MSRIIVQCAFLITWIVNLSGEVYQDRPKIKTADGDLILEPAYDKNIYLLPNGPKSSIFVGDKNILEAKVKNPNSNEISNGNNDDILYGPNGILKRLELLESNRVSQLPNDVYLNISTLWRKVNNLNRKVLNLQTQLSNRGRDECESHPCKHGGTCLNLVDGYHCLCPNNWEGQDCDEDVNECRNFAGTDLGCQNGATCINKPGTYECLCKPKWFGIHCTRKEKDCTGGDFEMCGHGKCIPVSTGNGITCICYQGWTTNGTSESCLTDVNECESKNGPRCSVNPKVECINLPGSFRCGQCPPGYEGDGYTCTDIDECLVIPNGGCSPLVSCYNTIGSRTCGSCPPGYIGNGVTCVWRGSCSVNHGGCHPSARCIDNIITEGPGIQCICPEGMQGDGVGLNGCYIGTLSNVTASCRNNPCGPHGECHVVQSGYTCVCQGGYSGANCNVPTNPCTVNPCLNNGVCRRDDTLLDGYRCECQSQYSGRLCQVYSRTCGGVLDNEDGNIMYPMSNTTYSHDSRCAWVIHTVPGKVINVTFTRFNVEDSPDCSYDFLQIHDGRSSASQLIGRFCGNSLPKGGNIISSNNNLYFWFRSDSSVAKQGFALHWTTVNPVCGGEVNATTHGHISSPGSPGKYPPNRDCYWHLKTSLGKRIQLHFFALDLETHSNCSYDYLSIYDGTRSTDPLLNKYCNTTQPAPVQSAGSDILIHFHSDAYGSGYGFQLAYAPAEGVPGCGGYYTTDTGEIISPSFNGTYLTSLLCDYQIKTSPGTKIRLDFKSFHLERSFRCKFDNLKVYDGSSSDAPLVGRFCGTSYPKYYISTGNTLYLQFRSDMSVSAEGFKILYRAICQQTLIGDSGIIETPGYPFSYPGNKACEYIITTTPGKAVVLSFQAFDIEDSRHYLCQYDYVEVRDGSDSNSTLLGKYCGNNVPPTLTSTHNHMYIKFKSDLSVTGTGFYANYTTIDVECGGIYTKTTGLINHPSDETTSYKNDQNCTWLLVAEPGMHIKLTWNRFEIENMASCAGDYLELIEIDDHNDYNSVGKFCGTKSPPALTLSTNKVMIKFVSDSSVRSTGFSLSYTFLDAKSHCGGVFLKSHGFIYSPNWPNRYEINRDCKWTIIVPVGQQIRVNITNFDLERPTRNTCIHGDFLELRDGTSATSPMIGQYCGKFDKKILTSFGNSLYIHFHSDFYLTGNGFKLEWDGSITGCGGTLTSSSGIISSPNYPENYDQNSECFYKIITSSGSRIRISFTDLDLERTNDCKDDYIEIFDGKDPTSKSFGRKCFMSPTLNNIESTSNNIFIKFRSDFYNERKGFLLNYYTMCSNNITGRYGIIESPDFPNNYPLHSNCLWTINVPKGNKINVTFSHFDIFQRYSLRFWARTHRRVIRECDEDYLQWKEPMESSFSTKLCGSNLPPMISTKGNSLQIKFASSGYGSRTGFRLEWVSYGCGGHVQKRYGMVKVDASLTSNEIECEWLVETPSGTSVSLTITGLYLMNSVNCTTDVVEFYNGLDTTSPLISKLCVKQSNVQVQSTSNYMFIKFTKRSSIKGAYFSSSFSSPKASCGGTLMAPSGYIYSKNYPKNYDDNLDCVWIISAPLNRRIHLKFEDFDLYSFNDLKNEINCADNIKIYDELMPLNYSQRICAYTHITDIVTKHNKVMIQFTTNNFGNAKGFKISFRVTCGGEITANYDGVITNNNYVATTNESCIWTIIAPKLEQKISLTITHLDLPQRNTETNSNRSCSLSYLQVYDGNDINAPLVAEYCGHKAPPLIISQGSFITVKLGSYTNEIVGHFSAHYSVLSTACGGTFTSEQGSIVSPNYPRNYPVNADCEWILSTSPGNKVSINFEQFQLEDSDGCNDDYLEIRERSSSGLLLGVYCGSNLPVDTRSAEKLYIKFHSNDKNSAKGFILHYEFLHGNEITGLEKGVIASPLYPHVYRRAGEYTWRIFVQSTGTVSLTFDTLEIPTHTEICESKLSIYDGYDETAPLLDELCGIIQGQKRVLQTTSNVAFIKLTMDEANSGALFYLIWKKTDKIVNSDDEKKFNCGSNTTILLLPGNTSIIQSPNYPNTYDDNLNCEWVYQASPGRHLSLHFQEMDLEEINHCYSDYINVYSSRVPGQWRPVIENLCEMSQITGSINSSTYMKVNFKSDYSMGRKGFRGQVNSECGGYISDLSGEIGPTWEDAKSSLYVFNKMKCEWVVKVRPGRVIELYFVHFNISNTGNQCLVDVTLRNGDSTESPFLSSGKYCGHENEVKTNLVTSSNALHVTFSVKGYLSKFQNFIIHYEEKGVECGVTSKLEVGHTWEIINSPNYPLVPTPFSECVWIFTGPPGEILQIDFLDRFDLDDISDCGNEVVEIRDGSSSLAPLKGRYCGEKPGTIKTTSNTVFIKYSTQLSEPRNGFKANVSISTCGGTIIAENGEITSPGYPHNYILPVTSVCEWRIRGRPSTILNLYPIDVDIPESETPCATKITIERTLPGNNSATILRTFCKSDPDEDMSRIETFTDEIVIKYHIGKPSEWYRGVTTRGFKISFNSSRSTCGGQIKTSEGYIITPGYPLETTLRFCQWSIEVPDKTRKIHLEIIDSDPQKQHIIIANEIGFMSRIQTVNASTPQAAQTFDSSGPYLYLFVHVEPKMAKHKFKAKFTSNERAICGGVLSGLEGEVSSPVTDDAYVCEWTYNLNNIDNDHSNDIYNTIAVTSQLNSSLTRTRCRYSDPKVTIRSTVYKRGTSVSHVICGNTASSFLLPSRAVSFKAFRSKTDSLDFKIQYKAHPCGGVVDVGQNAVNILNLPGSFNVSLDCAWVIIVPFGSRIQIKMEGTFTYDCDDEYIKIKQGLSDYTPAIGQYCKTKSLDSPLSSNFRYIFVEYHSKPQNNSQIKLIAQTDTIQCGGELSNSRKVFSSPNYPKNYNPNEECTWTISTNLGNRVSISFIGRFIIEDKPNCTKDALIIYDWKNEEYHEIGRLCGRETPKPFNSTYNKMKVVFRTDDSTNLEGFKAVWNSLCGGKYVATNEEQFLYSPGYPSDYQPLEKCVYEISAPDDEKVIVKFVDFKMEGNYPECEYDNLTLSAYSDNRYLMNIYCGTEKPPTLRSFNKVTVAFKSDEYLGYKGFELSYSIYRCGGLVTNSTIITSNPEQEYDENMNCTWIIKAPTNKVVSLKFLFIDLESTDECYADYIAVFDGSYINEDNRLALLCGQVNSSTALKSKTNEVILQFVSDYSYSLTGFKVQVLFTYSESVGCGGHINMTSYDTKTLKSFILGNSHVYENYLDCVWIVTSPPDTVIKIEFTSFHIAPCRDVNQTAIGFTKCDCDFVEIKDGINIDSITIGTYCGHNQPPLLSSSGNMMSVRLSTDGEITSSGFEAKLTVHNSLCGKTYYDLTDKSQTIKSPILSNGAIPRGLHCVYYLKANHGYTSEVRVAIKHLDLRPASDEASNKCNQDKLLITIGKGLKNSTLGKNFISRYSSDPFITNYILYDEVLPQQVEFCGKNKPSDLYLTSNDLAITLMTSPDGDSKKYTGVEIEFNYAGLCGRNYTGTEGKIITKTRDYDTGDVDTTRCFTLITAPENHTISLYFIYVRPDYWNDDWYLQIYDGDNLNSHKIVTMTLDYENNYPTFFSTGRYMLLHQDHGVHVEYDLNFITTDKGRGCGGKLTNELGRVASPMYPEIYRNTSVCEWELQTPLGTNLKLHFAVFDLGKSCDQNYVQLVNSKGEVVSTYCSEVPADYLSTDNYVKIVFHTTRNNGGTGWVADFVGIM